MYDRSVYLNYCGKMRVMFGLNLCLYRLLKKYVTKTYTESGSVANFRFGEFGSRVRIMPLHTMEFSDHEDGAAAWSETSVTLPIYTVSYSGRF